jgi:hypothetical protein
MMAGSVVLDTKLLVLKRLRLAFQSETQVGYCGTRRPGRIGIPLRDGACPAIMAADIRVED